MVLKFANWLMVESREKMTGRLSYGDNNRVVLEIGTSAESAYEFGRYLRSFLPKSIKIAPQMYPPHITVVRAFKEYVDPNHPAWKKHDGRMIDFEYDMENIYYNKPYYFLKVYSDELKDIREELGLPRERPGFKDFHLTIGNTKS